jgi:hypothetical protein
VQPALLALVGFVAALITFGCAVARTATSPTTASAGVTAMWMPSTTTSRRTVTATSSVSALGATRGSASGAAAYKRVVNSSFASGRGRSPISQ